MRKKGKLNEYSQTTHIHTHTHTYSTDAHVNAQFQTYLHLTIHLNAILCTHIRSLCRKIFNSAACIFRFNMTQLFHFLWLLLTPHLHSVRASCTYLFQFNSHVGIITKCKHTGLYCWMSFACLQALTNSLTHSLTLCLMSVCIIR